MKFYQQGLRILASFMLIGQIALPGMVLAADEPGASPAASVSVTPSVSASATPSDSQSPSTSLAPSASPASPSPAASQSTSPALSGSPQASASESASPSGSATPTADRAATGAATRGADQVCHGNPPDYVFDDSIHKWVAADMSSFNCDKASGYFLSPLYYVDTRTGWYRVIKAGVAPPAGSLSAPQIVHTPIGDMVVGSPEFKTAVGLGIITPTGQAVTSLATGSGSTNAATINGTNQTWFDMTNLVNVINVLNSTAASGGVNAASNTKAGDVTSGTVSVVANLINLLASAWSWSHGNLNFFMQNLFGNQTGDIHLAPGEVTTGGGAIGQTVTNGQTGANSTNTGTINNTNGLDVNAKSTGSITNNVSLAANSGAAKATDNTILGNVSTGNASAQANIINMINSFISSGSSFFGILNIFGNLNGDILFPKGFLNGLVLSGATPGGASVAAGGTGSGSTNTGTINNTNTANINSTSSQNFNNNVNTAAQSGAVGASGNTSLGTVASGNSATSNSLFNLSGSSIFGDNAVLVMVNVMGHWMGKLMSLPGGNTESALLTGNATVSQNNTGANSNNTGTISNTNKANVNASAAGTITNNVNVGAQSGDATVTDNTKVGNVATGAAKAASSVANIMDSAINIKHWFGVLIINVFGAWTGSVNEDTAAGNAPTLAPAIVTPGSQVGDHNAAKAVGFRDTGSGALGTSTTLAAIAPAAATAAPALTDDDGQVLTAAAHQSSPRDGTLAAQNQTMNTLLIASVLLMLIGGALFSIDRKLRHR